MTKLLRLLNFICLESFVFLLLPFYQMKVLIHTYNDKRYVQQNNVSLVSFNISYADYRNSIIHSVMLEMGMRL